MIDYARIKVIAGKGGDGSGSFTHIKGKRRGKADGGDGGLGGDVFLEATLNLNTLEPFRYVKEYKASNGGNGASRKRKGVTGEELVIKVPVGTVVKMVRGPVTSFLPASAPHPFSAQSSSLQKTGSKKSWVRAVGIPSTDATPHRFDLVSKEQRILVATGGDGGRGNSHLRDEFGRRPLRGEKGKEGEKVELELELKLIADVGLIGLPNAGKSTLIAALTSAQPKVADYPFTTLEPNLGVMKGSWFMVHSSSGNKGAIPHERSTINDSHLVLADIPGLIEGASRGKGLGDLFLRHIERTKLLVHLVDVSSVNPGGALVKHPGGVSSFWDNYQTVRKELRNYSKELVKKKEIIVLNKIDQVTSDELQEAINQFKIHRKKVIPISAKLRLNLEELINEILRRLK